jgi:hypothetical protein
MSAKTQPTWGEKPLNAPHHYNMESPKVFYRRYRLSLGFYIRFLNRKTGFKGSTGMPLRVLEIAQKLDAL